MRKLAIMFVMLLGSIATMQAQTFDFSCTESRPIDTSAFTEAQVAVLTSEDNGFIMVDDTTYDVLGAAYGTFLISVEKASDGSFLVFDAEEILVDFGINIERSYPADQFAEAVAYAIEVSNYAPVSLTDGYSSDQVSSLQDSGFTVGVSDNDIPTANFEGMVILDFGTVAGDISVQYSVAPNTTNPGGNGFYSLEFSEYYSHRILYGTETARYTFLSNSAEETIEFLATLLPSNG